MAWTAPRTWVAGETLTAALLNAHVRDNLNAAFPVGSLHYFIQAGTSAETTVNGFALECNAVSVLRATYSSLNTLLSGLSYPFGSVDGTHMTLPDLRARSPHGMASGGHTDMDALGDSDGQAIATRTHQHNHTNGLTVGSLAVTPNPHTHTYLADTTTSVQSGGIGTFAVSAQPTTTSGTATLTMTGAPGGTIGPGGTLLTDKTPWLVAGIWSVKY